MITVPAELIAFTLNIKGKFRIRASHNWNKFGRLPGVWIKWTALYIYSIKIAIKVKLFSLCCIKAIFSGIKDVKNSLLIFFYIFYAMEDHLPPGTQNSVPGALMHIKHQPSTFNLCSVWWSWIQHLCVIKCIIYKFRENIAFSLSKYSMPQLVFRIPLQKIVAQKDLWGGKMFIWIRFLSCSLASCYQRCFTIFVCQLLYTNQEGQNFFQ